MKYFVSKRFVLLVKQNEDGSLFLTKDGVNSMENAGWFINSMGGIQSVLNRCIESDMPFDEFKQQQELIKAEQAKRKAEAHERAAIDAQKREEGYKAAYEALKAQYAGGAIPTTYENIGVVLRGLNAQNWGGWELPKMTIGYRCNQYNCDGKIASTMVLDEPINISSDPEYKEMESRFQVGAPHGHLMKYRKVR